MPKTDLTPAALGLQRKRLLAKGSYKIARELMSRGQRECDVARALTMSAATFSKIKASDPMLQAAVEEGLAHWHAMLIRDLNEPERVFRECEEKGLSIQQGIAVLKSRQLRSMFLLKTRFSYIEGAPISDSERPQVIIQLPGSMAPDQYIKTVSVPPREITDEAE